MRIREHRGSLADSMATVKVIKPTHEAVAEVIRESFKEWPKSTLPEPLEVEVTPYPFPEGENLDLRIGWNTHVVKIPGIGVFGFTDGPLED